MEQYTVSSQVLKILEEISSLCELSLPVHRKELVMGEKNMASQ